MVSLKIVVFKKKEKKKKKLRGYIPIYMIIANIFYFGLNLVVRDMNSVPFYRFFFLLSFLSFNNNNLFWCFLFECKMQNDFFWFYLTRFAITSHFG